jgi:hypothetical protein
MKNILISRFKEPSTWAGLAIIATLAGVPPGTFELLQQAGIAVAGLLAIFMSEKAA